MTSNGQMVKEDEEVKEEERSKEIDALEIGNFKQTNYSLVHTQFQ